MKLVDGLAEKEKHFINKTTMKPTLILILLLALAISAHAKPLKVFILAGQSNMEDRKSVV